MIRIVFSPYADFPRVDDLDFPKDDPKSKSMTQQNFAEDVDVNLIVARAIKTGFLADSASIAARSAIFGDFTSVSDFHDSMNKVLNAQAAFAQLPVDVRVRFNNDPGQLIGFIADPANLEESVNLGLLPKSLLEEKVAAAQAAGTAGQTVVPSAGAAPAVTPQA